MFLIWSQEFCSFMFTKSLFNRYGSTPRNIMNWERSYGGGRGCFVFCLSVSLSVHDLFLSPGVRLVTCMNTLPLILSKSHKNIICHIACGILQFSMWLAVYIENNPVCPAELCFVFCKNLSNFSFLHCSLIGRK